jgi:hypothetical protein
MLEAFSVDANKRAVQFLNIISTKYANLTLQDLILCYDRFIERLVCDR